MYASLADRSSRKLLDQLVRVDVLMIDELGYINVRPEQSNIFFKLLEERYRRRPTVITTNLDYDEWGNFLGNKGLVDALLSRLRHQCHTITIDGPLAQTASGLRPSIPHTPQHDTAPFVPPVITCSRSCSVHGSFIASTPGSVLPSAEVKFSSP